MSEREEIMGVDAPATAGEFARDSDPGASRDPVRGTDIAASADAMEDATVQMAELLAGFAATPRRSLDARAVFLAMARTAEQMRLAAGYLRQQDWLSFADEEEPEVAVEWSLTLANLGNASRLFEEIANGWI